MSDENAQTSVNNGEASAKKGGTQFIIKMIVLGLLVLAIVFYVQSLNHKPGTETTAPASAEQSEPASAATGQASVPVDAQTETAPASATTAAPQTTNPVVKAQEASASATAQTEHSVRPLNEEEALMRQIQETFAPETLR